MIDVPGKNRYDRSSDKPGDSEKQGEDNKRVMTDTHQ